MENKFRIIIGETENFSPKVIMGLKLLGEVILKDIDKKNIPDVFKEFDVFWFRLKFKIEKSDFPEECRCKYIVCPVTGLDHIDLDECAKRGIQVLALRGEKEFLKSVRATAEHTIGLTLALLRNIPSAVDSVKDGIWQRDLFKGREIYKKKVGILGVGRLGEITANLFKAFGAEVIGYDINDFDESICKKANTIEELLEDIDILSIHLSLNNGTTNFVDKEFLSKMKSSSILINTSRGAILNSGDLLWALQAGKISGAALDVVNNEYYISDNELINYAKSNSNLIITPHIGGNTYESFEKTELFLLSKLKARIENEQN
ncbi:MAG: D-isomer specific 2-hydroxyacid dehydrogenase family protein [Bacteroidota bacterium]